MLSRRRHSLRLTCGLGLCLASILCPVLKRIEVTDGMLIAFTKEVGVYIERDTNATVSELLPDVLEDSPLADQTRVKGMPEVMGAG